MATDADEVADDYRHALEDLSSNMRFEISNLTVIARENTEHALKIADILQQHILKAPPNKKLPALYVLDSIVKNVGTPYTIYFGRNLFKTFMESFAVVDAPIRRKMEEMLRTWKDPVPGSLDTRPVFSHDLVRPIENALMKARAASVPQQNAVPGRPRSAMLHRDTPTPPALRGQVGHLGNFQQQQQPQQQQHFPMTDNGRLEQPIAVSHSLAHQQPPVMGDAYQGSLPAAGWQKEQVLPYLHQAASQPVFSLPASLMPSQPGPPGSLGASSAGGGVETLSNDIQNLVAAMKVELSRNPNDASVQNRFRALLNLQGLVQSTSLPQDQLELIKNKVTELAAVTMRPSPAQASAQNLAFVPMQGHATLPQASPVTPAPAVNPALVPALAAALGSARASAPPAPSAVPIPRPSSQASVTVDGLLGKGALAALLSRTSTNPRPLSTQPLGLAHPSHSHSPLPTQAGSSQPATANPMSLLEQLRQAGMLPSTVPLTEAAADSKEKPVTAPQASSLITPASPPAHPPLGHISQSPSVRNGAVRANPDEAIMRSMTTESLQNEYHPEAVAALYEDLGPACTQCGRRFKTDARGKKKVTHMDWHFRVHQRTTEAEKKGTHRSWYVDQQDWLKSREVVDSDMNATASESAAAQAAAKSERRPQYIAVPDPSRGINNTCPICQEKFDNKWLDTAQEWVWLGAVLVGNRAYHATCHAEATRDRQGTPNTSQPPPLEGFRGKRKAETSIESPKVRTLKTCV